MSTTEINLLPPPETDNPLLREYNEAVIKGNKETLDFINQFSRRSFKTVYRGYILLILIGTITTIFTIYKGLTAQTTTDAWITFGFGGLSAASFMALFISRPLESIERNSIFVSWLSVAINSYATRMMYLSNPETIGKDIRAINKDFIKDMTTLAEKHAEAIGKYKDLQNAPGKEENDEEEDETSQTEAENGEGGEENATDAGNDDSQSNASSGTDAAGGQNSDNSSGG